jgi:soluble lytic murein transglycosylase-like protein
MSAGLEKYACELALELAAHVHSLDPALMKSLAWVESAWNPHAVSSVGAQGLCQLMPRTSDELGVAHPFDAMQSALAGGAYLRGLLTHYKGDMRLALAAYNWGRGHLDHARALAASDDAVRLPAEVDRYVRAVLEQRELFAAKGPLLTFAKPEGQS